MIYGVLAETGLGELDGVWAAGVERAVDEVVTVVVQDVGGGVRSWVADTVPRVDGGARLPEVPGDQAGVRFVQVRSDQP